MQQWFDGIWLLRQFGDLRTGCWLLAHGTDAAVLELPPYRFDEASPVEVAQSAVEKLGCRVRYLLCTHAHADHFCADTLDEFQAAFPNAITHLQRGFRPRLYPHQSAELFEQSLTLFLDDEPLYLLYAPKHSWTDTMIVFRGAVCTGDWELETIRSVHDGYGYSVPLSRKLESIDRLRNFPREKDYLIHRVYSVHANDRRPKVDFTALMASTREDRRLW